MQHRSGVALAVNALLRGMLGKGNKQSSVSEELLSAARSDTDHYDQGPVCMKRIYLTYSSAIAIIGASLQSNNTLKFTLAVWKNASLKRKTTKYENALNHRDTIVKDSAHDSSARLQCLEYTAIGWPAPRKREGW